MTKANLQVGGGYTHQWKCAILLALNYFFEPVCYNPILFDLINDFLGEAVEIHLEGEDRGNDAVTWKPPHERAPAMNVTTLRGPGFN